MKRGWLLSVGICVILGILMLTYGNSDDDQYRNNDETGIILADEYRSELERICAFMCSSMEGVETAHVNITLDGGMRCIYAKNSEGSYGGTYFSSGGEPLFLKYNYPEIMGCAVMCSGTITDQRKLELTEMLCAYLGISSNKIYIAYVGSG